MVPDIELRENVTHGTKQRPITGLIFANGPGTDDPEPFFVGCHWHSKVEIILIQQGSYQFEINLEKYILREGDLCLINSGDLHQITGLDAETRHQVVLFEPEILDFSYDDEWEHRVIAPFVNQKLIFKNILRKSDIHTETAECIQRMMDTALSGTEDWYVRSKLLLFLCLHALEKEHMLVPHAESGTDARKIGRYKTLVSYMDKHYAEPVSLQKMADIVHCNRQYLCRFFKEISGVTPIQYMISRRIESACRLLDSTDKAIVDISMECGFDNLSYFIRKFKEKKGCTPGQYRAGGEGR